MSCVDNVCGTGGSNLPKPGDPDNFISLRASTTYGGIEVNFSYPATNPFAVAYVHLYRGTTSTFTEAAERALLSGSVFYDRISVTEATEFYYWVQIVTVNGTTLDPIGPASAVARPLSEQTMEELTGKIDASLLAQTLKTDIGMGAVANQAIIDEAKARLHGNDTFNALLAELQSGTEQAMTLIKNEITQRKDGETALAQSIQFIGASNDQGNVAGILEEKQARVTADDAMADDIKILYVKVGDSEGGIVHDMNVIADKQKVMGDDITIMYGAIGNSSVGLIHDTNFAVTTATSAANDVLKLATKVGDSSSGLIHDVGTFNTTATANAHDITTLNATINGDTASGQVGLVTNVNKLTGALDSMWFAKVESNGLIGGFGVYNDSKSVLAGFDVDTFYVGRTGSDAVKPFIIDNGITYIDKARIRNADIDSLKIAGDAVTVPVVVTTPNLGRKGQGEGVWTTVNTGFMNLSEPGIVYILATMAQGFSNNQRYWAFRFLNNGVENPVRGIMGRQANDAPVFSLSVPWQAGVNKIELQWSAHPDVVLGYTELFLIGAKR